MTESVFPVGGEDVPPIFVLGKENADKQAEVERLKARRSGAESTVSLARQEHARADKELDKHCIARATVVRESLRAPGNNSYNNYDKARYKQCVNRMISAGDKERHLLDDTARERLTIQTRATLKDTIEEIQYQTPDLRKLAETTSYLMQRSVVSTAIAALQDDPPLASWTRQGLGLHQTRHAEKCLFCDQPMPDGRIARLEGHFSTEYDKLQRDIDAQIEQFEAMVRTADQLSLPNRAQFYDDLSADYEAARLAHGTEKEAARVFLESLIDALQHKKARVFEAVALAVPVPATAIAAESINEVIRRHNAVCTDFGSRVASAREALEADSVAASLDEYQSLEKTIKAAQDELQQATASEAQLASQIFALERNIVEHHEPAEELNSDLHKYLGHSEIQLEVKDTGYTVRRNGQPASALSEGERTAIALLYFLKSLRDRRFDLNQGVVVLDDPVSSLDANALFLAFGFVRLCTEDAAQVIILTHNFPMFRQIRNWFHYLPGQRKSDIMQRPARFYMLDCRLTDVGRRASICPLDPLLEKFESEYHYLFSRIYRKSRNAAACGMEGNYLFPNMARRLLESFLAFRCPQYAGQLSQGLQGIDFDEGTKLRILRFLHTQSHLDSIGEAEHDPSALGEAEAVLRDLLSLIKKEDPKHHDAMVALVEAPDDVRGQVP